jgi:hypothetical protein
MSTFVFLDGFVEAFGGGAAMASPTKSLYLYDANGCHKYSSS